MKMDYDPLEMYLTRPFGKFYFYPKGGKVTSMQTVHETRRQRLELLLKRFGSLAELNAALHWDRTDSRLSRIKNANRRTDREDKVFQMGDGIAREIELTLNLGVGWMDTPPTYAEIHGDDDPISKMIRLAEAMEPEARYQALRLLDVFAQPSGGSNTGTDPH